MSEYQPPARCANCGTELSRALLACPMCHTLVYRERLAQIAKEADTAVAEGDADRAATLWRQALPLLPPNSSQHEAVAKRIEELMATAPRRRSQKKSGWKTGGVSAVVIGLLAKGKLLLAGLLKLPTLLSMLAFVAVYLRIWGWKFALAFVIGIYIHEIGHVAALRARGLPASAPMFIPGLGAFVRLQSHPATPREDSYIGLAGPIWGVGASLVAVAIFAVTGNDFWAAVAQVNAVINIFNLTPVWQLDGSRGFASQSTRQRWMLIALIAAVGALTRQRMLILVGAVAIWRAFDKTAPRVEDWSGFTRYAVLVVVLSALTLLPVIAQ